VQEADERPVVLAPEELLSPELVLVDSDLAQRARADLLVPAETIDQIDRRRFVAGSLDVAPFAIAPAATTPVTFVDDEAAAALRRLSERELDAYSRPSRRRRPALKIVALACAGAVAVTLAGITLLGHQSPGRIVARAASTVSRPADGESANDPRSAEGATTAGASAAADPTPLGAEDGSAPDAAATGPSSPRQATQDGRLHASRVPAKLQKIRWSARRFIWPPHQGATSYHVEFLRGGSTILVADPRTNRVVVPATWRFRGRSFSLDPDDRLSVWPMTHGLRGATAIISGELVVDLP
jgi:hypothetical protein